MLKFLHSKFDRNILVIIKVDKRLLQKIIIIIIDFSLFFFLKKNIYIY